VEKIVSRSKGAEPAKRSGKKHFGKLSECDQLLDLAPVLVRDPHSRIILWTSGDEKLYGYTRKEAISQVSHDLFKTNFPISREAVDKSLQEKGSWQGELTHTTKDGHQITVASRQVLYTEDGHHIAILEVNHDITELKQAENALRESEANLVRAQQITHLGNWSWDLKDDKIICSDEFYRIFTLDKQEYLTFEQFLDTLHQDDRERVNQAIETAIHDRQPYSIDYRITPSDGSERLIHAEGEVHYSRTGKPQRFFGTVQDITSKRQADRALAEYTTKLQEQARIIDLAHVMIRNMQSQIILWTGGDEILYGYPKEEALGKVTHDLFKTIFPISKEAVDESLEKTGRWQGELTHTAKDGHKVVVASHQVLYKEHSKPVAILEVNNDITERKQAEEMLRRQAALIDLSPDGIFVRQYDGTITFWSHGAESLYGWTKKETVGKKSFELLKKVFPQPIKEINQQLLKTHFWSGEVVETAKDGRKIIVQSRWMAELDEEGNIREVMESNVDVTGRKQIENRLREAKNQAELYLDIMGHDINNLNQVALANLDLIKDDENLTADQREALTNSLNSVRGSAAIIDNVRKIQAITHEKLAMHREDIDEMIQGCIVEAPKPAEYAVKINYTPRKGCMIMGTALMKEVFCNIINNSIKHAGKDVTIDIQLDETLRAGKKFYEVSIADSGPGIPDELKPKLFARFQRGDTKAHGKGLGLFIVKSLVETAGGNVTIEDRVPGDYTQGTRFIVSLPASEGYR